MINWPLAEWARLLGTVIIAANLVAVLAPAHFMRAVQAFPRNRPAGWILTAVDLFWVSFIVLNADLGRFEHLKPLVYVAGPASFLLIVFFMDELLAPRVLGGFLLLLANPILNAARWHPSAWRLVMTVTAYLIVIAGIIFVLGPYRFRQFAAVMTKTEQRCRAIGLVRVVFGCFILYLGLSVY